MGVDVKLFVVADHSGFGTGFVSDVFSLHRDRDLWSALEELPKAKPWPVYQLPAGSWTTNSDGQKPTRFEGATKADSEEREMGYLAEDPYGNELMTVRGAALAKVRSDFSAFNNAVLDFIGAHFADRDVVVFWC